jgi:hypothetical protein
MLFKIELSPEIKSIGREQIGPGQNRPENSMKMSVTVKPINVMGLRMIIIR